jgi:hypothetical protein
MNTSRPGTVYLLHFDQPYRHARHCTGKSASSRILKVPTGSSASEFAASDGPPGSALVAGCAESPASQQAASSPSVFTVAVLVILTSRYELEHGVAVRLGDEVLHRGVLVRLEVRSRSSGDADVAPEDGPGLVRGDLSAGGSGRSRLAQAMHRYTAWPPICSVMARIPNGAESS